MSVSGLTVYSAAGVGPLPKNGTAWHEIRQGCLKYLDNFSKDFNDILKVRYIITLIILM